MPPIRRHRGKWTAGIVVAASLGFCFLPMLLTWKTTVLGGLLLVILAAWLARREHAWLRSAHVVHGTVAELIPMRGGKGGTSYRPRVRFTTPDGAIHDFVRSYSSNPAGVSVGESLAVAYRDDSPQEPRILTFGQRYGFAAFLGAFGVFLVLLGGTLLVGRHYVPRVYLEGHPASTPARGG